jgi:hypothetical protein
MPMPKGKKVGKYVTLSDRGATQFRLIAENMTQLGWKMNHATARGVLLQALKKIARKILIAKTGKATSDDIERMIKSVEFQEYVANILEDQTFVDD